MRLLSQICMHSRCHHRRWSLAKKTASKSALEHTKVARFKNTNKISSCVAALECVGSTPRQTPLGDRPQNIWPRRSLSSIRWCYHFVCFLFRLRNTSWVLQSREWVMVTCSSSDSYILLRTHTYRCVKGRFTHSRSLLLANRKFAWIPLPYCWY